MKNNTLKASLLAIVASSSLMLATAHAQESNTSQAEVQKVEQHKGHQGKHRGHRGVHKMFKGLGLSDTQRADIKALIESHKELMKQEKPSAEERAAKKSEVLSVISAANFDESKAQQLIEERSAKRQQKELNNMKLQNQIYQLLTPEQQAKFAEKFNKQKRRKHR